jgi:type I restriction enzyme S subunit
MTHRARLKDVALVIRGVTFDKTEVASSPADGLVPILRAGNISESLDTSDDLVWVPSAKVSDQQMMRIGDIAICMSSGSPAVVGKTASLKKDWFGSAGAFCAIIRPTEIDATYLGFFLRSDGFRQWTRSSSGANIKNIRKSELEDYLIPVPPFEEQRRTIDVLSQAESIVFLCRQARAKADELAVALFLEMFGDPASNPKGWPVTTLGHVLTSCDYGTSKKSSLDGSGVAVLRMGNVTYEGSLALSDLKHVELDDSELAKQSLAAGDILFNRTNSKELVGKTGLWDGRWPAVAASYFIRLRANSSLALPIYIWAMMNSQHMKRRLLDTARGAIGQANINARELKAFPVALPPLDLQRSFAAKFDAVNSIAHQQEVALLKAKGAFAALLHSTFSH